MKTCVRGIFWSVLSIASIAAAAGASTRIAVVENFEAELPQTFPTQWRIRGGDQEAAQRIYRVEEEGGNRFLHAHAENQAIHIGLEQGYDSKKFPFLQWRWRVWRLPPGADERRKETHDSGASVYVIFDNQLLPRILKYAWSTTVPVGARIRNPFYWRGRTIVLQSGPAALGQWQTEVVNVYQDYRDFFGEEPGPVQGIGLLTCSDSTQSVAIADYDDFSLSKAPPLSLEEAVAPRGELKAPPFALFTKSSRVRNGSVASVR